MTHLVRTGRPTSVPLVPSPSETCDSTTVRAEGATRATSARTTSDRGKSVELAALNDLVDDAVGLRLLGREDLVALDVGADRIECLAGVPGQDRLHLAAHPLDLGGVDLQVGDLATGLARGLVDEHPGVRQREALARRSGGEQHGGGRGG